MPVYIDCKKLKEMKIVQTTAGFNSKGELAIDGPPAVENSKVGIIFLLPGADDENMDNGFKGNYFFDYDIDGDAITVSDEGIAYNQFSEGDIVLVKLPQSAGDIKLRPAVVLKQMPSFNDFLICGISSQQHHYLENFDELLDESHIAFTETGLHKDSVIRLSALTVFSTEKIMYTIGKIPGDLHKTLLKRLGEFLLR